MNTLPWFQFYARDWVLDAKVKALPLDAQGAYMRLLAYQWIEGSLPIQPSSISVITELHPRSISRLWPLLEPFFPISNTGSDRRNTRLDEQRKKMLAKHLAQSEAGQVGAEKRWGSHSEATEKPEKSEWGGYSYTESDTETEEATTIVSPAPRPPKPEPVYPQWAHDLVDLWEDTVGLPTKAKRMNCVRVVHDLHRLDKQDVETIQKVVTHIVSAGIAPTYIRSPSKLRKLTRDGEEQTFKYYLTGMNNNAPRNGSTTADTTADDMEALEQRMREK